jgi:TfoX/Sxy family transcriptional regulator of competence genes
VKKGTKKKQNDSEKGQTDARFAPVVQAFKGIKDVRAGKLFSSFGLKVSGKIFAMYGRGRLVVKLPKERVDGLVSAGKAERFNPGHGRLMKEWAAFESDDSEWVELAREAYKFVQYGKSE